MADLRQVEKERDALTSKLKELDKDDLWVAIDALANIYTASFCDEAICDRLIRVKNWMISVADMKHD